MPVHLPAPAKVSIAGHEVAPIAWGMWRFAGVDLATARARIDAAFEVGVTLFDTADIRSEEHTSELQSLMRISYAVFCLKKTKQDNIRKQISESIKLTTNIQY